MPAARKSIEGPFIARAGPSRSVTYEWIVAYGSFWMSRTVIPNRGAGSCWSPG